MPCRPSEDYVIDGRHEFPGETLPHLEGYMKSSPVSIGDGAHDPLQLDPCRR